MSWRIACRPSLAGRASLVVFLISSACTGQDLARREGIGFRHSRFASFRELSPVNTPYRTALEDALRECGVPPGRLTRLPRVVKGNSYLVDPPYLGKTSYARGIIFVWDGREIPLREVLTHEMIHWVLFYGGEPSLAANEVLVSRLADGATHRGEDERPDAGFFPGDFSQQDWWRHREARERSVDLRRGTGEFGEPDAWAQAMGWAWPITQQHP